VAKRRSGQEQDAYDYDRLEKAVEALLVSHERAREESASLRQALDERDERIRELDGRLLEMNQRRQDAVKRIDQLVERLEGLDARLDRAEQRVDRKAGAP